MVRILKIFVLARIPDFNLFLISYERDQKRIFPVWVHQVMQDAVQICERMEGGY
jgi:bifunctional DNase/RNase